MIYDHYDHYDIKLNRNVIGESLRAGPLFSIVLAYHETLGRQSRGTTPAIGFAVHVTGIDRRPSSLDFSYFVRLRCDFFSSTNLHESAFSNPDGLFGIFGQILYRQSVELVWLLRTSGPIDDTDEFSMAELFLPPAVFDPDRSGVGERIPTAFPCHFVTRENARELSSVRDRIALYPYSFTIRGRRMSFNEVVDSVFGKLRFRPGALSTQFPIKKAFRDGFIGNCSNLIDLPDDHFLISDDFTRNAAPSGAVAQLIANQAAWQAAQVLVPPPIVPKKPEALKNPFHRKRLL